MDLVVSRGRPPRARRVAAAAAIAVVAAGLVVVGFLRPASTAAHPEAVHAPASAATPRPAAAALPPSGPTRLVIPMIAVDSPLVFLGLQADQSMEVPSDFDLAGWYRESPTPGEIGPAIIAGHVDSHSGPAVFSRLDELEHGDEVRVERADGTTARFRVDRIEQVPKDDFPTHRVYGDVDHAGLRLITCGGEFDHRTGQYRDNIVVYASLAGPA